MNGERWIEVAERLGRSIVRQALWQGGSCTWTVYRQQPGPLGGGRCPADGFLYQGSAGIALFLGELAAATGDGAAARAALGGIAHALAAAAATPPERFGFHTGRVGVAWVAARLAALLERPELAARAWELLAPMQGREERDGGRDVIGGAAGAVPALLALAPALGRPEPRRMAERLGEQLVATAGREACGWSWSSVGPAATRNLAGFAHGASGAALSLLELAAAGAGGRYRFAADMALLYERRLFDAEQGNWPDVRHAEINQLFHDGGDRAVREADAAGSIPPYRPGFMVAWCHGAAGIGLARLRAWELTGEPALRREAELAVAATLPTLEPPWRLDQSQCHGVTGNCELPRLAAEMWGDEALAAAAATCAERCRAAFDVPGRNWPCGTVDRVSDPSLLLGEAGIGHFYLRLARPEVPSFLLLRPAARGAARRAVPRGDGYRELEEEWLEARFGGTRAAFAALGALLPSPAASATETAAPSRSPIEELREAVERAVAAGGARRHLLRDAARLETAVHDLAAEPYDLTEDFRRRLRRGAPHAASAACAAALERLPQVRLVRVERDWQGWSASGAGGEPPLAPATWLVARRGREVLARRVGPLAAAVLEALDQPRSLPELVVHLAERFDAGGGDGLAGAVGAQVEALYQAGLLEPAPAPAAARAAG